MPEKKATGSTRKTAASGGKSSPARVARARPAAAATRPARRAPAKTAAAERPATPARRKSRRRALIGNVVSDRTPKTVVVEVTRLRRHPLYKRVMRVRKRYATHDPNEEAKLGDLVRIEEGRPYSAQKRFHLAAVVSRAGEAREAAPEVEAVEAALEEAAGVREVLPHKVEEEAAEPEGGER